MKIVVGIDGSRASQRALEWAVEEARVRHGHLKVINAWQLPYMGALPTASPVISRTDCEAAAAALLERALADVDTTDVYVESVALPGPAAMLLVEASTNADLVVVGSRGHGGFTGLMLGSVSQHVVSHAHCPVVVVRDGA